MLLHILKMDLKRKKTMNLILFIFVLLASMFLASSVDNLRTVYGAVDEFMEMAKVPDYIVIAVDNGKDEVGEYLKRAEDISEFQVTDCLVLGNNAITVLSKDGSRRQYERTSTLSMCGVPDNFMKVFDSEGQPLVLKEGEIAIPGPEAEANHIEAGDRLEITIQNVTETFTVKTIAKDAIFGSPMISFKRFCVNPDDFQELAGQDNIYFTRIYQIDTPDIDAVKRNFNQQDFQIVSELDRAMAKSCYIFDMLVSAVLIIMSVCLILISFMILRFSIVFHMQEDYREIGIMKAIGIRDSGIKYIYLLKYFAISMLGTAIGLACSFRLETCSLKG